MEEVQVKSTQVFLEFMNHARSGILLTFDGMSCGDHQVGMNLALGCEAVEYLRQKLNQELGRFITDYSFGIHLTLFRGCKLDEETKAQLKASIIGVNLGSIVVQHLVLRKNRRDSVKREALTELAFCST